MVFAQALHLIVQRSSPTNVIAIALREGCLIVGILRLTAVPAFRLGPVAAQREFRLGDETLDDVPRQGTHAADALTVADAAVVVDDSQGTIFWFHAGTTQAQVGRVALA